MDLNRGKPGAIILAGGKSSRMGSDKALLEAVPGGLRLIEMVLAAVRPVTGSLIISTNQPAGYTWLNLPLVPDNYPGLGPLAGLEAGLATSNASYNLLVACDMPYVKTEALRLLLSEMRPGIQAVVPLNQAGRPEPLCAVYSQECLPAIRRHLLSGSLKMTGWLSEVETSFVAADKFRVVDPDYSSFKNLNTPNDIFRLKTEAGLI